MAVTRGETRRCSGAREREREREREDRETERQRDRERQEETEEEESEQQNECVQMALSTLPNATLLQRAAATVARNKKGLATPLLATNHTRALQLKPHPSQAGREERFLIHIR